MSGTAEHIDPGALALAVADLDRPLLIGLDVDGVLAPIVRHPDDSALVPGILDAVAELSGIARVAVVSGRSVRDLSRFAFPADIVVVGTHGLERAGAEPIELTVRERAMFERLGILADQAADRAGRGAWVETKPFGLVLHVRESDPVAGEAAVNWLTDQIDGTPGVHTKIAKAVVEMFPRPASKATAITALRDSERAASVVYVGDDAPDEEVFAVLDAGDLGVRVGPGDTVADHRLADPDAVLSFLRELPAALGGHASVADPRG